MTTVDPAAVATAPRRFPANPLLLPEQVLPSQEGLRVIGVFNPAVADLGDRVAAVVRVAEQPLPQPGRLTVAFREPGSDVQLQSFDADDPDLVNTDKRYFTRGREVYYTSLSHLRLATSVDGLDFRLADGPVLPTTSSFETFGMEDPRLCPVEGGQWLLSYVAVSPSGACTALASTRDFVDFTKHGMILLPNNKNCAVLPVRLGGLHLAFHRPSGRGLLANNIWLAESPDLVSWGRHRVVALARPGMWDSVRLGIGPAPVRVDDGWLALYYGVDRERVYRIGALLLDAEQPWRVLARSRTPLMVPEADYERGGFMSNVLFPGGMLLRDGHLLLYYGAGDRCVCAADLGPVAEVVSGLEPERGPQGSSVRRGSR